MRLRCALGLVLVATVVAGQARAQSGDSSALAEQLFNQGRELAKANRWSEACPKFEASLRYDPVLGTRLNLATCYERIGKLASAWAHYRDSIDLAKKAGDTKRQDYAKSQAASLEPRLAKLTITAPAKAPGGFTVTRDGTPIEAGALGAALYADAGPHEIVASAPGFKSFTRTVILVDGAADTLVIPALEAAPATPPPATVRPPADELATKTDAPPPASSRKYVALGVGAAGVVAVGVGLFFGSKASSGYDDAKALCGDELVCIEADKFEAAKDLMSDARTNAGISTALVITGGATIAIGTYLFLTAPRARERVAARITPVPHAGGAGLVFAGRF